MYFCSPFLLVLHPINKVVFIEYSAIKNGYKGEADRIYERITVSQ